MDRFAPIAGHHDLGGQPGGPIARTQHAHTLWEKRIDAMMVLLFSPPRSLFAVDEMRRAIEQLPADAYHRLSYYERWSESLARLLVEKGVLTQAEIAARIEAIRARESAV